MDDSQLHVDTKSGLSPLYQCVQSDLEKNRTSAVMKQQMTAPKPA
jgi:hypothetical protein